MSHLARAIFSIEGIISTGFVGIMWLWSSPYLTDVVEQFEGPFSFIWDTVNLIVPIVIGAYYIIYIGFLLWGPVEQERARQTPRRRP